MPTDLEIIEQLEKEINVQLKSIRDKEPHTANIIYNDNFFHLEQIIVNKTWQKNGYAIDENKNVIALNLDHNELFTIPSKVCSLKNLQMLFFTGNKIKLLPSSFGQLQNLNYLDLSENNLEKLPYSFGQLQNLNSLDLENNQLKELPTSFGQLQN
ncbi:hypothetical protein [Candidatus Albibeggiatoa sp. nov. NOAA]|uniref:leucine-rich repeat domain-containing protein n=1 Tax=Candidatus Albibeggiatoa sp. nov. NOAA TaxID=3162724 RepID=UPI0033018B47|nr:hypothetical protein [Thiotrichaceae bacterium]